MSADVQQHGKPPVVSIDYISASANRYARAAHYQPDLSLIAFGSGSFVSVWAATKDQDKGVLQTLPGHEGLVTCIHFNDDNTGFFSADEKGTVRCWKRHAGDDRWITAYIQRAHKKSITSLGVHRDLLVTGSSDAQIAIWKVFEISDGDIKLEEIQRLDMKGRYPFDIQISLLPDSTSLLMAVASTERNVSLYVRSEEKFHRVASLPGHEDWVKSLSFQEDVAGPSVLTLASASQDGTIRLWNIEKITRNDNPRRKEAECLTDDLLDTFEATLGGTADGEEGGKQISMKRHVLIVKDGNGSSTKYSVTFDALLIGHEAGVTSITWRPVSKLSPAAQPMLMSTSTDSSVILWAPSSLTGSSSGESTSLWINQQRFGDIGGQRLGGFVGGLWACGGCDALAWGWTGGWRRWRSSTISEGGTMHESWDEISASSGHNGAVRGISWSPRGEYLISTSPDQTTRIHANGSKEKAEQECWHEICRPQVHGYDLIDATFLSATRFISIADEKVARVFDAPKSFVTFCKHLSGILTDVDEDERPLAASVPPLGLSNKALSGPDSTEAHFPLPTASTAKHRPFEGELMISTLWPEIEKVFGHGYELHAIAAAHAGNLVATACRATSPEHAGIKVYDTKTWQLHGQALLGHQLTVTRLAFSPDDRYLLSVSRDRSWMIYERKEGGFSPIVADKSHTRIIWDCAWSTEGDLFATASRDKTVKIWGSQKLHQQKQLLLVTIKTKDAATALAFSHTEPGGRRCLAVGLETGVIIIYSSEFDNPKVWRQEIALDSSIAHTGPVHRLAWRPQTESGRYQLASSSEDRTLRILRVLVNNE